MMAGDGRSDADPLRRLARPPSGLVRRQATSSGRAGGYQLTTAGEALSTIVWDIGHWAAEWMFSEPTEDDCDGLSLIWRMHQAANPEKLPATRTVVHLDRATWARRALGRRPAASRSI